ncbi:MAG: glycosyltransferase family 4 protein [Candidatus Paceibacterota bacterium]|jgi:glycosyltransferase involved in cell wall biosynthesis
MKITYIANARIPTEKAHGIQIMKTCEALARSGASVTLIIPTRRNIASDDPFHYYGIARIFSIKKIFTPDLIRFGKFGFLSQSIFFSLALFFHPKDLKNCVIYSRDAIPLFFLLFFYSNICYEEHTGGDGFFTNSVAQKCRALVVISQGLKDFFMQKGVLSEKILVANDGVDLKQFQNVFSCEQSRKSLGLPIYKKIIVYSGSVGLYDWKGLDIFLDSASFFDENTFFLIVGGSADETKKIQKKYLRKNILFVGQKEPNKIPPYLHSADVLIIPNKKGNIVSSRYTSPMKLFEYMASGVPIVASDLPSIREILNEKNSFLVQPDDASALANGIKKVLADATGAREIANRARRDVAEYSWEKRAEKILKFISLSPE